MTTFTDALVGDLAEGVTPYHVTRHAESVLCSAGFTSLPLEERFPTEPGRYLVRRGGFLAAWVREPRLSAGQVPAAGYVVVGAHTDSPGLRLRPRPERPGAAGARLGVEVYGGPLLYTWLDRDLGLAGRVGVRRASGIEQVLVHDPRPVARVPSLAIHLAAEMHERGAQVLRLNPQEHLDPLWALGQDTPGAARGYLAALAGAEDGDVVSADVMFIDTAAPTVAGRDSDLLFAGRMDNQLSCVAGVRGLIRAAEADRRRTPVLAMWDHEEVGSETADGAGGTLLSGLLERISASAGADPIDHLAALAGSLVVSADAAHATHPAYPGRHEPAHPIALGGGVVIKRHAQQRYATASDSEAPFRVACADAGVPVQLYSHRGDMPCGSTIGPMTAARLAVPTIDIGAPLLGMHSISETAALADADALEQALTAIWTHD